MHEYTAVISSIAYSYIRVLEENFDVLPLPPDMLLDEPVRCHADMIMFCRNDTVILPESYVESYPYIAEALHSRCGARIITSDSERGREYPRDISLNVLLCGNCAFSLKRHTAPEVMRALDEQGVIHENIRQGYSACSTLSAGGVLITADSTVLHAAEKHGVDALAIADGHISLDGYDHGFIGGACGVCENTVYFLGNIMEHPDGKKIRVFLKKHGFDTVSLSDGALCDFGGIKFLKNKVSKL